MKKLIASLSLILVLLLLLPTLAGCVNGGVNVKGTLGIAVSEDGKYTSVTSDGAELISAAGGGFSVYDFDAGKSWPLTSVTVKKSGSGYSLSGNNSEAGFNIEAKLENKNGNLFISGTVKDTTGQFRRFRLDHALPINADGFKWWKDLKEYETVAEAETYYNRKNFYNNEIFQAEYPFAALTGGRTGIAVATDFKYPVIHDFYYDGGALVTSYYMGLSPETKRPSEGSFSFMIYDFDGEDGVRGAVDKLYRLLPDKFSSGSDDHGNWLFQQSNIYQVNGVEDFVARYNENPNALDNKYGVTSLIYVAPAELWISWRNYSGRRNVPSAKELEERLDEMLGMTGEDMYAGSPASAVAKAVRNARVLNGAGRPWTVGWSADYDHIIAYISNGDPDIAGDNCYTINLAKYNADKKSYLDAGFEAKGLYVDNTNFNLGTFDYNADNFKYCDYPLLWDYKGVPVIPLGYSTWDFIKKFADEMTAKGYIAFGNIAWPDQSATMLAHLLDVPGGETGSSWGQTDNEYMQRRVNAGRKPWAMLLTQSFNDVFENVVDKTEMETLARELMVKRSLYWGVFANVLGLAPNPAVYESVRGIFTKYTWTVKNLSEAGWEPLTRATAAGVECERFGGNGKYVWYTVRAGEATEGTVSVDLAAVGFDESDFERLRAVDSVNNAVLPAKLENGRLTVSVSLADKDDVTAFVIAADEGMAAAFKKEFTELYERLERSMEKLLKEFRGETVDASEYTDKLASDIAGFKKAVEDGDNAKTAELLKSMSATLSELTEKVKTGKIIRQLIKIEFTDVCERYAAKTEAILK